MNALYHVRMILLGKSSLFSKSANTSLLEETKFVFASVIKTASLNVNVESAIATEFLQNNEECCKDSDEESSRSIISTNNNHLRILIQLISESDKLLYIAGYIAKKFLKHKPHLRLHTKNVRDQNVPTWLQYLSFGGLIQPSDSFLTIIDLLEI